ncbi:MAG: hypothetical protein IH624_08865 [Phycisphaerae bacterium]|nr:hypothetical protein [Phycisphaerae bacterium]
MVDDSTVKKVTVSSPKVCMPVLSPRLSITKILAVRRAAIDEIVGIRQTVQIIVKVVIIRSAEGIAKRILDGYGSYHP